MSDTTQSGIARWQNAYANRGKSSAMLYMMSYPDDKRPVRPPLTPENMENRLEWSKREYEYLCARAAVVQDDLLPHLCVDTGTEIYAQCFGCAIYYPPNDNPCAVPLVQNACQAARIRLPKLEDTPLMRLFETADKLRAFGGGQALIKLPDVQTPMDIVAQIWDKTDLFTAMIQTPQAVLELAAKAQTLLEAFLDEWMRRYGRAYIAHFPSYYMEGGVTLSVDEVGNISPDMFETFFARELADLSRRYGGIGIHCCANSRHQWANFSKVEGLRLINLCLPEETLRKSFPVFAPVCVQYPFVSDFVNPRPLDIRDANRFPGGSYVLSVHCDTQEEAARKLDALRVQTDPLQ